MSDRYIEKGFLYLLLLSVLFHITLFGAFSLLQPEKPQKKDEPMMVDLKALELPQPAKPLQPSATLPLPSSRLGEPIDNVPPPPRKEAHQPYPPPMAAGAAKPLPTQTPPRETLRPSPEGMARQVPPVEEGFKPRRGDKTELAKLFPSEKRMASLEESYRKKYEGVEQGDTRMIDTDDPLVSVYGSRLLVAANDSFNLMWRRAGMHDTGVGVLQVTIRRDGTVENVKILESSKSRALDDLVSMAVRQSAYVGPLPKKWPHEKLKLVWVFASYGVPLGQY